MRQLYYTALLLTGCAVATAQQVEAPPPASPITDRFSARVSYYAGTASTNGHVTDSNSAVAGTPFSLENDLGLPSNLGQGRVELIFRLRERGRLRVDMWQLNRRTVAAPDTTIVYGNILLTPADQVESIFVWRQMDFTWTYSFLRGRRYELGAGLGMHLIQGESEERVAARGAEYLFTGAGPFGTVALDGTWLINRRFALCARAQYMNTSWNSKSGMLGDYHVDVQFRWLPNLAVGLGYASTKERIEVRDSNPNGEMQLDIHGGELFVRASF